MKILIKNGTLVNPYGKKSGQMDILIEGSKVIQTGTGIPEDGCKVIDVTGQHIMPSFVDMHCHLREPGFEYKETIKTGSMAAVKGGYGSIACMANTNPAADCAAVIEFIKEKAREAGYARVYPIGAVTQGLKGEALAETGELKDAGAVALSDDGKPIVNAGLMRNALTYAKNFDMLIISHCEEPSLANGGFMNEGRVSTEFGLKGIPGAAEEIMAARDVLLAEAYDAKIHIAHVSTKGSVEIIRQAKRRGVKVTCETTPHYFSLTEEAVKGFDTNAKVNPPLRTNEDVAAIIEGLKDGTIDAIATDHAPHHADEKNVEFAYALNGISGLETAFSLCIMNLVKPGILTLEDIVKLLSHTPAKLLGIPGGAIEEGGAADLCIVNINEDYRLTKVSMVSLGKNTPFIGQIMQGCVTHTMVNGRLRMENRELL
jgi:dihydroorotase